MTRAFALAGLGGFNAHGAGFLQAAMENDVTPDLVTATSGQIVVLGAYLNKVPDLGSTLIDPAIEHDPLAQLRIAFTGYKGVFAPAYDEAWTRLLTPPYFGTSIDFFADRYLPAQLYKPSRSAEVIQALADTFNASPIGVVFNAYDPVAGLGRLYGNDVARALIETESSIPVPDAQRTADPRLETADADKAIFPIDAQAIASALWLSLYGFDGIPGGYMDGAYHRSCIVSELHTFDEIFVCRPLANGWGSEGLPKSYFDVQDWNTEMWFSVGYKAEVDAMKRINTLVERGAFAPGSKLKAVTIHEIAPATPAGYFNYFIERESVFKDAKRQADALFRALA